MKKYKFSIRGHEYNVEIQEVEDNVAKVEVNGTCYQVELQQEVKKVKTPKLVRSKVPYSPEDSAIKSNESPHKGHNVKAPLPGNIFKVLVHDGDIIEDGQTVLILEAMKMENNIVAEIGGVVSLKVKEGDAVMQGDLLAIIS